MISEVSGEQIILNKNNVKVYQVNIEENINTLENPLTNKYQLNAKQALLLIIDLKGSYPLQQFALPLSNTDVIEEVKRGSIYLSLNYSLDNKEINTINVPNTVEDNRLVFNFPNTQIRYLEVKIYNKTHNNYILNAFESSNYPNILLGQGIIATPNSEWTDLFTRKKGWTGADGIYSIPMHLQKNGSQLKSNDTLFLFGDSFIGDVDEDTKERLDNTMVNNTIAYLSGNTPNENNISFIWDTGKKEPQSVFTPNTNMSNKYKDTYYWLQDGLVIDNRFYCMPLIVAPNPQGKEGFEFQVHGVTCVSTEINDTGLDFDTEVQIDTPLYFETNQGITVYFGAGFMHQKDVNGHKEETIFVYGLYQEEDTKLVVAKTTPEHFTIYEKWEFWNGTEWSKEKKEVVPIANEISSEFSVSYLENGTYKGKYIIIFQEWEKNNRLSAYIGDTPVGPFNKEPMRLHYCNEHEEGKGIYVYNAKAHPHLSGNGDLLVSYNVNTASWKMHEEDGTIYRPRFIDLIFTEGQPLDN